MGQLILRHLLPFIKEVNVDRASAANGALTASGTDTTGNVYFKSESASKVGSDYNTLYNSLVCNSGNSNILAYDKAVPEGKSASKCYGTFTVAVPQTYLESHSLENDVWYARSYILVENKTTGEIEYHYGDIAEFDLSDPNASFTRRTDVKNDNLLIATL